ncbi:hypothetical protein FRB90_012339 [Tulasnella sp. 427]|nr:hypothetical protein FRB90_012339 [Tulasnella sp. 427]
MHPSIHDNSYRSPSDCPRGPPSLLWEPSRWGLYFRSLWYRVLLILAFYFHKRGSPRPLEPRFIKYIYTTISAKRGRISLVFFTPKDYDAPENEGRKYPCFVDFYGGGFTVGRATDDARWATAVCEQSDTIVCCVNYRRAPEYPFPTAVEDGTDAVLWIQEHANELRIDRERMGLSGFSAGGNLSLAIPLLLRDVLRERAEVVTPREPSTPSTDVLQVYRPIKMIVAFYPSTDYTVHVEERRKTNVRMDLEIPRHMIKLFDTAYMHPLDKIKVDSPYLSPGVASDELLINALPDDIMVLTAEYDEFVVEARKFCDRIKELGKKPKYKMVKGVKHGYNVSWSPANAYAVAQAAYEEPCKEIKRVFYGSRSSS